MLKLIYSLSGKEITLKFQRRNTLWSKELLAALGISLALHLSAMAFFRIKSHTPFGEKFLSTSRVVSDTGHYYEPRSQLHIDENGFIQQPPLQPDVYESVSVTPSQKPLTLTEYREESSEPRTNLTTKKYDLPLKAPKIQMFKVVTPIQIGVSEHLQDRFEELKIKSKKVVLGATETLHCAFEIEVEDRVGKVFQARLLKSCGIQKYDFYASKLLKSIQFKKLEGNFITKGDCEILIEVEKRELNDSY